MNKLKNMSNEIKISSNRSFGVVFFIFFLLISCYIFFKNQEVNFILISLSIIFLILGVLNSKILTPLNYIWFRFGMFLGYIISPIIMGLIYFFLVTPIGIITKLSGKNLCNLKKENFDSYWIKKKNEKSSMKNQF